MPKGIKGRSVCSVEDCPNIVKAYGLCRPHARKMQRETPEEWERLRESRRPHVGVCLVDGCDQSTHAKGYCSTHYSLNRENGKPEKIQRRNVCNVDGCNEWVHGLGYCVHHWGSLKLHGDPIEVDRRRESWVPRSQRKCSVEDCDRDVHSGDLCNMHRQRNGRHGDPTINLLDRTHCVNGHEWNDENTVFYTDPHSGNRSRRCRICSRNATASRRAIKVADDAEDIDWLEVMRRYNWQCQLCGTPILQSASFPEPLFGTVDHIQPLARGGRHTWANVQAAHHYCNTSKNVRDHPMSLPPGVDQSQLVLPLFSSGA